MDHQSTESGALIGSNDDLLTEILLRLPVISIIRFKSVSKHWRWLLSDKSFTIRFDKLSKFSGFFARNKYVPFDVEDRSPPPFCSLDLHFDPHVIKIVQSCNGLLLIKRSYGNYYVYNPTTKQFAIIPPVPSGEAVRKSILSMSLAFHQTDCVHYKLVCVLVLDLRMKFYQIQVYSSDTGVWKISIESFSPQTPISSIGVYLNGAIYWASHCCSLWCYKIDVEELHSIPLPVTSEPILKLYFGESRGHLHLIMNIFGKPKLLHLNVYEMSSDYSGWFVKYQLEFDELAVAFPEMIPRHIFRIVGYSYKFVDLLRGGNDEDTFLVLLIRDKLIKYNIHDKSFKLISILPCKDYYDVCSSSSFHRYTEALASL